MVILLRGDEGDGVRELQEALASAGFPPRGGADGKFGPATDEALRAFQRSRDLVTDGIAGPKTLAALHHKGTAHLLHPSDLQTAADTLDVELAAVMAINEVESKGAGFLPDGRPVILFERHVMYRRLVEYDANAPLWQEIHPNVISTRTGGYEGYAREWPRLGLAWSVHPEAAIESASWGLFQIMGFHWKRLGYESAHAFMGEMRDSEGKQLEAFVRFIKAEPNLHRALKLQDWPTVARLYNGPQFAKHNYHGRMHAAYERHSAALEATV